MKFYKHIIPLLVIALFHFCSCKKKDTYPNTFVSGYWTVDLTATNKIPGDSIRKDHGYATINLMSDSTLAYNIYVSPLGLGDVLTSAQLYSGTPAQNGTLLTELANIKFDTINQTISSMPVRKPVLDSLRSSTAAMYLVVCSKQQPTGLLRGQVCVVGQKIGYAIDVSMAGNGVTPPVITTATGSTVLRLMSDNATLYYNVQVTGLNAGDVLTSAAVRKKSNGSAVLQLASAASGFNTPLTTTITSATAASLKTDSLYIDVRTAQYPNGLIAGKIR